MPPPRPLRAVVQQDPTGCALASVAVVSHRTYAEVKAAAANLGIAVSDATLWSHPRHIRTLLAHFCIAAAPHEEPFVSWSDLPPLALLAIKWHREKTDPAWHWVVFAREGAEEFVLDSKRTLRTHRRTDFGRMKPKWFIRLDPPDRPPNALESRRQRKSRG